MRQGILDSGAFILFLSAGILSRPFCASIMSILQFCFSQITDSSAPCLPGQFEIREAIAHRKPMVLIRKWNALLLRSCLTHNLRRQPDADESDARHGAYDFYAEQLSAPPDLQHLTDENESMAFRRRGE